MRRSIAPFARLAACAALLAACADDRGAELQDDEQQEVVVVRMTEYSFESSHHEFVAGKSYRFVLRNDGTEPHEWAIVPGGDATEDRMLTEVEEDDLPPGAVVEHVFAFPEPGSYDMSCFMPGHYEGGMVLPVRVVPGE